MPPTIGHLLENILYGMHAVTALQFWMADIKPHILSDAIESVYTAFLL